MDEKKLDKDINVRSKELADEEIVKDIERSTGMPSYWKKIVLDLIHRQKAEIERLTEEANQDTITHIDICTENLSLRKQNAELQKQVDEYRRKIKDKELIELPFTSKEILEDYAHRMFDSWNDVTGAIDNGRSWYFEVLSVIDDIVGMAYGITKRQTENATAEEIYSFLKEHSSGAGFSLVRAYFMEHYGI